MHYATNANTFNVLIVYIASNSFANQCNNKSVYARMTLSSMGYSKTICILWPYTSLLSRAGGLVWGRGEEVKY